MDHDVPDVSHLLPDLLSHSKIAEIREERNRWTHLDAAAKRLRARTLFQQRPPETDNYGDNITSPDDKNHLFNRPMQDEPRERNPPILSFTSSQSTTANTTIHSTTVTATRSTTRINFPPQKGRLIEHKVMV